MRPGDWVPVSQHPGLGPAALTGITIPALHRNIVKISMSRAHTPHTSTTGQQVAPRLTDINLACELNPPTNVCRLHVVMLPLDSSHHYTIAASHSDDSHLFVFTDLTN